MPLRSASFAEQGRRGGLRRRRWGGRFGGLSLRGIRQPAGIRAAARGIAPEKLEALIAAHTRGRDLGVFGEPHVRVLDLDLALAKLASP